MQVPLIKVTINPMLHGHSAVSGEFHARFELHCNKLVRWQECLRENERGAVCMATENISRPGGLRYIYTGGSVDATFQYNRAIV